jgi:hypothetical protein
MNPNSTQALKKTTIAVIGSGKVYASVQAILTHDKVPYMAGADIHFLSASEAVVDGFRVQADRFLVLSPAHKADLSGTNRLPVSDSALNLAASTLFVGDGQDTVLGALSRTGMSSNKIVSTSAYILPSHDKAVQEVIGNYLRKQKVDLLLDHSALSTTKNLDGRYTTVVEKSGHPTHIKSDVVFEERLAPSKTAYGFENIGIQNPETYFEPGVHRVSKRITLLICQNPTYTLTQVGRLVKFALSKSSRLLTMPRVQIASTSELKFFTIGEPEQTFDSTHLAYKRSVVAIRSETDYRCFVKVITSMRGNILSISGVVSSEMLDPEILIPPVSNASKYTCLLDIFNTNHKLARTFIEVCAELRG